MSGRIRQYVKQAAPLWARNLVQQARAKIAPIPIDEVVLAEFNFAPDQNPKARLNFVIPTLSAREAFGGVITGIEVFLNLVKSVQATTDCDARLIITDVTQLTDPDVFLGRAKKSGVAFTQTDILLHSSPSAPIRVRSKDLFMTYNWWTTLNIASLRERQVAHFGTPVLPMLYIIQDYEPNFYPFSAANLLARGAYDSVDRLWGIFNSSNLQNYFELLGHSVEKGWVFDPVVNDALRPFLDQVKDCNRKERVIVYGRPNVERNCFSALIRGLKRWASDYPQYADWEVVSAGTPHDPIDLGDGRMMRSLGKLPLDDYATTLLESSVGVSLMASPHPSYPPLEMAHFGVRVVTNTYTCKDLSQYHPNLISLPSISAADLAQGIAQACEASKKPPSDQSNPTYIREEKYPFLPDLAKAVESELSR